MLNLISNVKKYENRSVRNPVSFKQRKHSHLRALTPIFKNAKFQQKNKKNHVHDSFVREQNIKT